MYKNKIVIIVLLSLLSFLLQAQVKPVISLDAKTSGGYYQNYFDLGNNGFIVVLNKVKNEIRASSNTKESSNTAYYFSKDLSKRAILKYNSLDNTSFLANENFIVMLDKNVDAYNVKIFDYNGKQLSSKRIDLSQAGLTTDKISRTFLSSSNRINYEVYDLMQGIHLYYNDLNNTAETDIIEADIALPSNNPFADNLTVGNWKFLCEYKGYYTLYRVANDKPYNSSESKLHLAMYDINFTLFRELSSANILLPGETLLGNDVALDFNTSNQCFMLSYINKNADKYGFSIQKLKFDNNSNSLIMDWKKNIELIGNNTYRFVEIDGLSTPKIPVLKQIGSSQEIVIAKDRLSLVDEAINQICITDNYGNIKYNQVQMGDFDMLNLDGFCGDNGKMYARFDDMMMKAVLKQTCEQKRCNVLDICKDENSNELLIVHNDEKNTVNIYLFKKE